MLMNMVDGVIIDSFKLLRESEEIKLEDNNNKCFICGVNRKEFEKLRITFKKHTLEDHNFIFYLEFLMNLLFKPIPELEDDEIIIKEYIEEKNIGIFPIGCFLDNNGYPQMPSK